MNCRRTALAIVFAVAFGASSASAASLTVNSNTLTTFHTCVLTAISSTSTVNFDSFVNQASAAQNNGTTTTMTVNSSGTSKNTRTYIQFDLTQCAPHVPASAAIRAATVRLYATAIPSTCRTQYIFPVTAAWTELGIKWNTQVTAWQTTNVPATAGATSSMSIGTGCATNNAANNYVTGWNVTTDVQGFVNGTGTNNGWMVRDGTEDSATAANSTYASSEQTGGALKGPQLWIDYTT